MRWKKIEPMNQRKEFVLKSFHSQNFRALCEEYGISTKTGYKWQKRFIEDGALGLEEKSRRPLSHAKELSEAVVCEIIRLKTKHKFWGARKLRDIYARTHPEVPSESTFKRVLERSGLVEKRRLRHRSQTGRICTGRKASAPNQVWTVDFKGWWYTEKGERCEPLTVRDEYSRYLLELRAVQNARWETIQACFERLFERNGLPEAIRSDNGVPFASSTGVLGLSRLSAWWVALGIDLERSRPGKPQDNGAHERLHRDISQELECLGKNVTQEALDLWRHQFNYQRPHEALEMRCPGELYHNSTRKYLGGVQELLYDDMIVRRVNDSGHIRFKGQSLFISQSLSGWNLGLKSTQKQKLQ